MFKMKKLFLLSALLFSTSSIFSQATPPETLGVKIGDGRPQLSFRMLSGSSSPKWDDLKGKIVVIDFWATWCEPCVAAIPAMNRLHHEFADKVRFISVTYEPTGYVRGFLRDHPIESDVAIDDDLATFKTFKAWGIPVVFIFDSDGKLLTAVHPNKLTPAVLASAIKGAVPVIEQSMPWKDPDGAEKYFRQNQKELKEKYPR